MLVTDRRTDSTITVCLGSSALGITSMLECKFEERKYRTICMGENLFYMCKQSALMTTAYSV